MILAAALSAFLSASAPGPGATSQLVISYCDGGEHYQFSTFDCAIELQNKGDKPIRISKGEAKFPWDHIDTREIIVPAKGTSYINARVDSRNDEGRIRRSFRFATDEPGQALRGSEVRAMVIPLLDQRKPTFDFGVVRLEGELPEASLSLSSREVANFRIMGVVSKPEWVDVTISEDGRTIKAKLLSNAPLGLIHHDSFVKLKTNSVRQAEVWIAVEANVLGDIVPDTNPVQLGVMRTNEKHEFLFRVSSRSGKAVRLGKIELAGMKAKVHVGECTPSADACKIIHVSVSNDQSPGKLEGILTLELPGARKTLPIELVGMLLTPETKVHDYDELLKQSEQGAQSKAIGVPPPVDLSKILDNSINKEPSLPPGNGPLLRWSAAHQASVYGYVIYRSDSEAGPFLRINKDMIRADMQEADGTSDYVWRDNSAESGKVYWYQIGVLNTNGSRQDLTAAQKVTAK